LPGLKLHGCKITGRCNFCASPKVTPAVTLESCNFSLIYVYDRNITYRFLTKK